MDLRNKPDKLKSDVFKDDAISPRDHQIGQGAFADENPISEGNKYTVKESFSPELIEKAEISLESDTSTGGIPQPDNLKGSSKIRGNQHPSKTQVEPPAEQTSLDVVTGSRNWGPPPGAHGKLEDIGIANAGSEYSRFD